MGALMGNDILSLSHIVSTGGCEGSFKDKSKAEPGKD